MDKTILKVIPQVAKEFNLKEKEVEHMYKTFWSYIRKTISTVPLKQVTKETDINFKTDFNIIGLGKLMIDPIQVINYNKRFHEGDKVQKS